MTAPTIRVGAAEGYKRYDGKVEREEAGKMRGGMMRGLAVYRGDKVSEGRKSSRRFCPGVRPLVSQTADARGNALSIGAAAMVPSLP